MSTLLDAHTYETILAREDLQCLCGRFNAGGDDGYRLRQEALPVLITGVAEHIQPFLQNREK